HAGDVARADVLCLQHDRFGARDQPFGRSALGARLHAIDQQRQFDDQSQRNGDGRRLRLLQLIWGTKMRNALLAIGAIITLFTGAARAACPPHGYDRAALMALKAHEFQITDAGARNAFAAALVDCLDNPDSTLRDDIAFTALYTFMRANALTPDTM